MRRLAVSVLWTLNPNFDIRLAGNIAIPLGATLTWRTWGTAMRRAAVGACTTSARCGGNDPALRGESASGRASKESVVLIQRAGCSRLLCSPDMLAIGVRQRIIRYLEPSTATPTL